MAKAKAELSNLDIIKNSKNYTDLVFMSIKDLIGSNEDKKPTDVVVFPPYRAGENDTKMKVLYNDIDYDSEDFSKLKSLNEDYNIDTNNIKENLSKVYFNQAITTEKPKYSVSEIKKHHGADQNHFAHNKKNIQNNADTDDISLLEDKISDIDRVDGSQLGNMIHSFMECYDFETEVYKFIDNIGVQHCKPEPVGAQQKNVGVQHCKPESVGAQEVSVASVIDHHSRGEVLPSLIDYIDNINKFLSSDLGKEVAQAKKNNKLYREQRFMIELPLDTIKSYIYKVGTDDCGARRSSEGSLSPYVIVQGVIDAFFINENNNLVLIDYKTDGLLNGNITKEKLINAYKIQLEIYAKVLTQLTGKRVESQYLYSFALNESISV